MVRFRCWILGTKKAAFVVRLIEHGIPAANDPGLELFIRYLSIR